MTKKLKVTVRTGHPLAEWSPDHQHPRGTMNDSSVSPEFNRILLGLMPGAELLDLGCAGGGLVGSLLDAGAFAVGIDGSDYSQQRGRAEWGRYPENLLTADITEPFQVLYGGRPLGFGVVTMWEVLEHIPEDRLHAVASNIRAHLAPGGLLIVSIATCGDYIDGHEYHATQRPAIWWRAWLALEGFHVDEGLTARFDGAWVRGPNTGDVSSACWVLR